MALMLDTEVILTAALQNDDSDNGVNYSDLRAYCDELKRIVFSQSGHKCVYFGVDKDSLQRCVRENPYQFSIRGDRYHQGIFYSPDRFAERNNKEVKQMIESAIANMQKLSQ
ncbi:hypothetical protein IK110_02395 [Candidatus Saccharibacteria bacterium]|nr:hypothetical protein [Candidatus Saccharibacteria bacterium]